MLFITCDGELKSVWCICKCASNEQIMKHLLIRPHFIILHIHVYTSTIHIQKTWCTHKSSKGKDDNWSQLVMTNISILLVNTNTYTRIACILFSNCLRVVAIFCCWMNFWTKLVCQLINYDQTISAPARCFSASAQREGLMYIRV